MVTATIHELDGTPRDSLTVRVIRNA
jgi:hypothetical protein